MKEKFHFRVLPQLSILLFSEHVKSFFKGQERLRICQADLFLQIVKKPVSGGGEKKVKIVISLTWKQILHGTQKCLKKFL